MDQELRQELLETFKEVTQEGGEGNFLIVNIDNEKVYYIQFATAKGSGIINAEVVSNAFIPKDHQIPEDRVQKLLDAGWTAPDHEMANYSRRFTFDANNLDYDTLIDEINFIAREVFATEFPEELDLVINLE